MIEGIFMDFVNSSALVLEAIVVLAVSIGAIETLFNIVRYSFAGSRPSGARRQLWIGFARWLILALEFALAADIVRTAIAPSWDDIGQLAAIAAIRTLLGIFLERDISAFEPPSAVS